MKILFLDVETAPNIAHVWGLWNQNIGTNQLLASGHVLCWAAKWKGLSKVEFNSLEKQEAPNMLTRLYNMMDEADVVCHFNGTKFDIPTLNKEFLLAGWTPPSPYKQVDLLKEVRKKFKFPSNKLDYVSKQLKLGGKTQHNKGHQLWIDCMNFDPDAWQTMEEYNKQDVLLLEALYHKLQPWLSNHPNQNLYSNQDSACPTCGGSNLVKRGFAYTSQGQFQQYRCSDCGSWHRDTKSIKQVKMVNVK